MEEQETIPQPTPESTEQIDQEPADKKVKKKVGKKKILAVVGAILLLLLIVFLNLTGVFCIQHKWAAADCSEPRHCTKCGTHDGNKLNPDNHDWADADCVEPRHCYDCGITDGDVNPDDHAWEDATCIAPMTCWKCGATTGDTIGHKYNSEGKCKTCGISDDGAAEEEEAVESDESDGSTESDEPVEQESGDEGTGVDENDSYASEELSQSEIEEKAIAALYQELVSSANNYNKLDPGSCKYKLGTTEYDSVTDSWIVYGQVFFVDKNGGSCEVNGDYSSDFHVYVSKYGISTTCYLF